MQYAITFWYKIPLYRADGHDEIEWIASIVVDNYDGISNSLLHLNQIIYKWKQELKELYKEAFNIYVIYIFKDN